MPEAVTWIHDEMLNAGWAPEGRPAMFVFDDEWIESEGLALKRIVFMYESLLEMPGVEIRRGQVESEVRAFAERHGADRIETARSVDPRIKRQGEALGVDWIEPSPFVDLPSDVDLKRFSRYWRKAEKLVIARRSH